METTLVSDKTSPAGFSVPTQPCHPVSWDPTSLGLELLFLICFLSGAVFEEYSNLRNKDAEAVCDLSMYNYLEVNDLYFQPRPQGFLRFLRRKALETRPISRGMALSVGGLDNTPGGYSWEFLVEMCRLVPQIIADSRPKWEKCIPVFRPKRRKNPTRWGGTYLCGLCKGVPPPPRDHTVALATPLSMSLNTDWVIGLHTRHFHHYAFVRPSY